jgi:hypothetical protein
MQHAEIFGNVQHTFSVSFSTSISKCQSHRLLQPLHGIWKLRTKLDCENAWRKLRTINKIVIFLRWCFLHLVVDLFDCFRRIHLLPVRDDRVDRLACVLLISPHVYLYMACCLYCPSSSNEIFVHRLNRRFHCSEHGHPINWGLGVHWFGSVGQWPR